MENYIQFDFTITISVILALCALIAPIITAFINNCHQRKLRKQELKYDLAKYQMDILFQKKIDAYQRFTALASKYGLFKDYTTEYSDMHASFQEVVLLCDPITAALLDEFFVYMKQPKGHRDDYEQLLTAISKSFNRELSDLLPDNID